MTLEEIYYIGQTVAVIAIFATLVAVVWQGHQAAIVARAELTLNAHLQNGMIHRELADTPEKAELMVRLRAELAAVLGDEASRKRLITQAIEEYESISAPLQAARLRKETVT